MPQKSRLDRALSIFADVRVGEGATALLMLVNIFLLLVCYSVIKTVREPLILLGGGAEVRSYAAAGQAILLMAFVPAYGWFASRVNRAKLLVGVTAFFIVCIELFAMAVAARVPYVGVAFFVWVGIFNMSLVAQFWSFANDIYSEEAGKRLFFMRGGPHDFACASCHGQDDKRIRLQDLPNLTKNPGDGVGFAAWPAYRVSNGQMWTMQMRLNDCYRQQRFPSPEFGSDALTALSTYLGVNAKGAKSAAPALKR